MQLISKGEKGQSFEVRDNFMHLGALTENTSKDVTVRKALNE